VSSLRRTVQGQQPLWAVNPAYRLLDVIQNRWPQPDERFAMNLLVRRPCPDGHASPTQLIPVSGLNGHETAEFTLDTGASRTLVCRKLAEGILDLKGILRTLERVPLIGGGSVLCICTEIEVLLGKWITVPCYVPARDEGEIRENLLGMKGLLAEHFFCLDLRELHLFAYR
jgi:hypothetical protein